MKIHQVEVFVEKHYVIDPQLGAVQKTTDVLKRGTATSIAHADETYEIEPDGSFDVPDELAEELCKRPTWFAGPNPFEEEYLQEQAPAKKPTKRAAKS